GGRASNSRSGIEGGTQGRAGVLLGASARFHPAHCRRNAGNEPLAAVQAFFPEKNFASRRATAQRLSNQREIILVSLSRNRSKRPALHDSGGAGSHRR